MKKILRYILGLTAMIAIAFAGAHATLAWAETFCGANCQVATTATIENGAVTEPKLGLSDVTTADLSTTAHGLAPKAPNDGTKFLDGTGAWAVPGVPAAGVGLASLGAYFTATFNDGNSGTADTIDFTVAARHLSTLTGNVTYTFTDPSVNIGGLRLKVCQSSGSNTVVWPANVGWGTAGTAPTLSIGAGLCDYIYFEYDATDDAYVGTAELDVQ